ncbi:MULTISPECIES: response regulator transcription factor [Streptomyces]|uniref:Response regulator transcription factor n=1 Tax=Streptomyces cavourensis TaxID=67258 RepID=A0ABY5F362_9ACTN|nr:MULTISPECIES: response regulator transcription factor [Streptomyces]NUW21091.1 response regulator transcription factor [Streptomyces roseoviolaceus]ATY97956.1 DNA-binding response regulator [Streptomyces cavourensis]MBH0243503.1 response regulator transcription factor [Streptomyces cavourensis]NUV41543.1 response regulator transcription factor [Streptomyces sp. CAI-24]NUV86714.1 response regulator transcription factor [Streptomyces sp. KAI-26]
MTTVLLVHTVPLWRASLASLLGTGQGIEVTTADREAIRPALAGSGPVPDVILTDLDCPDSLDLLEEVRSLAEPHGRGCPLAVLTRSDRPRGLRRAYEAGARGYIDKYRPVDDLSGVMHKLAEGGRHIDESLAFSLLQVADMPLSPRELSVLSLAESGETVTGIAGRLHLTQGTVRNYLAAAIRKSGARNRVDAIRRAKEAGWI